MPLDQFTIPISVANHSSDNICQSSRFSYRVQLQYLGLATTSVAFAHGKKILGLNDFDELVHLLHQLVSHALGRNMRLLYKCNVCGNTGVS